MIDEKILNKYKQLNKLKIIQEKFSFIFTWDNIGYCCIINEVISRPYCVMCKKISNNCYGITNNFIFIPPVINQINSELSLFSLIKDPNECFRDIKYDNNGEIWVTIRENILGEFKRIHGKFDEVVIDTILYQNKE